MKKKLIALVLSVSMMVGLTACGGNDGPSVDSGTISITGETEEVEIAGIKYKKAKDMTTDNITLEYFHFDQDETVKALADRFMEIYPNIEVKTVFEAAGTYNTTLSSLISNKDVPDVFMYTDADFALSNGLLADVTEMWNSDPETKNLASTIEEAGLGMYSTSHRFGVPVKFFPSIMLIDRNVLKTLNIDIPDQDWTWDDMIKLIKDATVKDPPDGGIPYYGMAAYTRLDSYYGIAASQDIVGEFGYDGKDFDLGVWAVGEQQYSDLIKSGYKAPASGSIPMENWMGDFDAWAGASGRVALFCEAYWTFQGTWNTPEFKDNYSIDIMPYVVPAVNKEDASADHHSIATIDWGGISPECEHPREAYELLKFMSYGIDGWKTRIALYNDETKTDANGVALKHKEMPAPITTDEEVWNEYIDMYCAGLDEEHTEAWKKYFKSCMHPIPFGWTSIAGYWNYCDEYFNKIGIHDLVDSGEKKAADYIDEGTKKANWYHATAMLDYFGGNGLYDVLSDEEIAEYTKMRDDNA